MVRGPYPGHMKKAERLVAEYRDRLDLILEVADARAPLATRHPQLDAMLPSRERLLILTRADLADPAATDFWQRELLAVAVDAREGSGLSRLRKALETRRVGRPVLRCMVIGLPNVGKSSLLNRLVGRRAAAVGDRPGITRGVQWLSAGEGITLIDLPGLLPPERPIPILGLLGMLPEDSLDAEVLVAELRQRVGDGPLRRRFGVEASDLTLEELLAQVARRRGFLVTGGTPDGSRAARMIVQEFREGRLGRLSLEQPPGQEEDDGR